MDHPFWFTNFDFIGSCFRDAISIVVLHRMIGECSIFSELTQVSKPWIALHPDLSELHSLSVPQKPSTCTRNWNQTPAEQEIPKIMPN